MRISEAARRTGIPARLLRYYEEQGLLSPGRNTSGYRNYTEADIATAARIRQLLDAGLGTAAISTVLPCLTESAGQLIPTCPDLLDDLRHEQARIVAAIDALTASCEAIGRVIAAGALR